MALKRCPECEKTISTKARTCPHFSFTYSNAKSSNEWAGHTREPFPEDRISFWTRQPLTREQGLVRLNDRNIPSVDPRETHIPRSP